MSYLHGDKCSPEELQIFKKEVLSWLAERFDISKLKIKSYRCYNGDIRIYQGTIEYTNRKSSFRRNKTVTNGEITGYFGTRGHHTTLIPEYITINRDEWQCIRNSYDNPKHKAYDFNKDLIFDKLEKIS